LVQKTLPKAKLLILGQHITEDIKQSAIGKKGVTVTQIADDDVDSLVKAYHDSSVFASTIKGPGGTRLKNLAAMASQLPIVSTKVGVEGLKVKDKVHVLIGNTPEKIADLIIKVIKTPALAEKLAITTRHHVEENFDWRKIAKSLDSIYQKLGKNE